MGNGSSAVSWQTEWMDRTLKLGYSLQFCSIPPPFRGIREANLSSQEEIGFLSTEIQALLQKQAVSVVHSEDREKGLYSMYFLVSNKPGEFRPILDLRILNQHIVCKKFHMLTIKQLLELVQPGDWFTTIDLRDAYFHVKIAPKHRKYLCFAFQGIAYEYNRLIKSNQIKLAHLYTGVHITDTQVRMRGNNLKCTPLPPPDDRSPLYGGPEVQDTTAFQKTLQHFRKRCCISENTTAFQKTPQHFRKHYSISENTTAFQKTPQHFRKHYSISENTTAFQKTLQHFTKCRSISQNAAAFQKTQQHFRKHHSISELDGKGIPLGRTLLVFDWTEPAREALLWLVVFAASQEMTLCDWSAPDSPICPNTSAISC